MLDHHSFTGGILFVSTGNVCRSPYAERRLRQLLPNPDVSISSAGTSALVGSDLEQETREQLRRLGAEVTGFAARLLTPRMIDGAQLVLTMTRTQRGQVARLRPTAMRRIFALGDFADLSRASRTWRPMAPAEPWLPQVVNEAAAARGTVAPRDVSEVDVVDPFGAAARLHTQAFDRIEAQLEAALAVLNASAHSFGAGAGV